MKISYQQRLSFYFFIIFALFALGIIVFEQKREKGFRTEALEEKLDTYAEMANNLFGRYSGYSGAMDTLLTLLPAHLRLTIIDGTGLVVYDNALKEISRIENHASRPEIAEANQNGKGTDIRTSSSNNQEYLYYAKHFNTYFIRVALPYDVQVQSFLKSDKAFLYYVAALFLLVLFLINYVAGRFGKTIRKLNDFTSSEKEVRTDSDIIFPDDEVGEIGAKIAENYRQLELTKKVISIEHEKLLQHVHSSGEGLCFFSADSKVEFYNGLFIQYLNMLTDEPSSDPEILFTNPLLQKFFESVSADESGDNYFETRINRQAKEFTVQVNRFEDHSFEVIINDVTTLEKTRRLKQEMTGNIAHELRTPVTSIRGYLELMLEQPMDAERMQDFLTKAHLQTVVLSELIQDMGLISKIEEAPASFRLEPVSIAMLLDSLKVDLEKSLLEKNIKMEWTITQKIIVNGNYHLLYSIFRNLTDNVIRYAGNDVSIYINTYNEDKDFYYFSYTDTGMGIPDEYHLNRLFERFYRVNEGRTRDTGGSGLGLSIVKNAILFHKGTIVVKNRPEEGLEFLFKLPK